MRGDVTGFAGRSFRPGMKREDGYPSIIFLDVELFLRQ